MESYIVIYFFIVLIFLRGIFKDLKLLLFIVLSLGIIYVYTSYNRHNTSIDLVNNTNINKINRHNYGNISYNNIPLQENTIKKLNFLKEELNKIDLESQTKLELFSNVKKFLEIYHNFEIYDYKKNYLDDLVSQKTKIYNMISSLNIVFSDKDDEIERLFILVEEFLEGYVSKFKNANTYNFLEHPSGYEKNKFDLFL